MIGLLASSGQITIESLSGQPILLGDQAAEPLCNIETSTLQWCLTDVRVTVTGSVASIPPAMLIASRACSCFSPSPGPPNNVPDNSGSDDDDGGSSSGARGVWVWVAIGGGLGLLFVALLAAAAVRRWGCGSDRISSISLDPWLFSSHTLVLLCLFPSPLLFWSFAQMEHPPGRE